MTAAKTNRRPGAPRHRVRGVDADKVEAFGRGDRGRWRTPAAIAAHIEQEQPDLLVRVTRQAIDRWARRHGKENHAYRSEGRYRNYVEVNCYWLADFLRETGRAIVKAAGAGA